MKKILLSLILILATFATFAQAQTGGEISAKDNSATRGVIYRSGTMLKTWDSTASVWLSPLKLKTDSIYTRLGAGVAVTGTFYQATQPVSIDTSTYLKKSIKVSELPAITGTVTANAGTNLNTSLLALASKQPAIAPAGTPSTDVLTIQGISGMEAVKVDGSAVTQPISIAVPTLIYHNKKTVTTAGNRVALASSQAVRSVCIKALITNGGYIYVGDSSLSSTNGFQLLAGDTVSLDISNLNTIYIDSSVSGEGVTYISSN